MLREAGRIVVPVSSSGGNSFPPRLITGTPAHAAGRAVWVVRVLMGSGRALAITGWSARLGRSMYPTVSGSNTRLDGTRECSSAAVLVLPQPKVPFSQMIT